MTRKYKKVDTWKKAMEKYEKSLGPAWYQVLWYHVLVPFRLLWVYIRQNFKLWSFEKFHNCFINEYGSRERAFRHWRYLVSWVCAWEQTMNWLHWKTHPLRYRPPRPRKKDTDS